VTMFLQVNGPVMERFSAQNKMKC